MNDLDKIATRADIIQLLKDNPEKRFSAQTISKEIGFPYASVRLIMTDIGLEIQTERMQAGRMSYYYTDTPKVPVGTRVRPFKPLKLDQATQDALARCREDRGGEFHPISIS
jgi:hypothetical protein